MRMKGTVKKTMRLVLYWMAGKHINSKCDLRNVQLSELSLLVI
jgi:hypothetical protein